MAGACQKTICMWWMKEFAHQNGNLSSWPARGGSGSPTVVLSCPKLHTKANKIKEDGCITSYGRIQAGNSLEEEGCKAGLGF